MEADNRNLELSDETGDIRTPEEKRMENTRNAIRYYADIHLAMAKRQAGLSKRSEEEIKSIRKALIDIYQALSEASADGSLCVTLQMVADTSKGLLPDVGKAVDLLLEYGLMVEQHAAETGNIPLVYDRGQDAATSRIYFRRYWQMEKQLAELLASFAKEAKAGKASFDKLNLLLPEKVDQTDSDSDRRKAVYRALSKRLSIISGGPGTGKTTAVAAVLECLLASDSTIKIILAAPTGKAAGRMLESVKSTIHDERNAGYFPLLKEKESELVAHTMHKWLTDPQTNGLKPSPEKPLDCDVLVIDESSMIDIELAVRFLSVINPVRTRVILLGDPYQLAAVGPGSILADICDDRSPLKAGYVSELTFSYRFPDESPLGQLAKNIKEVEESQAIHIPKDPRILNHLSSGRQQKGLLSYPAQKWLDGQIKRYAGAVKTYLRNEDPSALWDSAKRFQALAATRHGKMSVDAINDRAEKQLKEAFRELKLEALHPLSGQMIIVRKNSSALGVYNGDIGIVLPLLPEANLQGLQVYFGDSNSKKVQLLGRLPQYERAFAITIHQSQGSEYEDVGVFLPVDGGRLATKELLYTAVTRVKVDAEKKTGTLALFGPQMVYDNAVCQPTRRMSGLLARLKEAFSQQAKRG